MNLTEAQQLHYAFLELKKIVVNRTPKVIEIEDYWDKDETLHFTLESVNLEELTANYTRYIGCGDYESYSTHINLSDIFKEEQA